MAQSGYQRLYVNVDHVATLRQARRAVEPDPVLAALECERAGADGITAHLREDRRHMQDDDIARLIQGVATVVNLEMACSDEMMRIALAVKPFQITFVPERREEVTTEGGLDVARHASWLRQQLPRLIDAGARPVFFIDPSEDQVRFAAGVGAEAVELHTGSYAHRPDDPVQLERLLRAATLAGDLGLSVHAGHGLTVRNVARVAAIGQIEELNIGHSIVSRSVFVGLGAAVQEMRVAMVAARASLQGAL
ncbi:MAG: pyridoxine 5'-phosphate synthase [Gemmatimonadota bacterium]